MTPGVTVVKDNTKRVKAALRALTTNRVYVGIPEAANPRPQDDEEEATNAQIGYTNEKGMPEHNIPARPHLVPGVATAKTEIERRLKQGGKLALEGRLDAVDKTFHAIGQLGMVAVKNFINKSAFVPLAEGTLARRRAKGRTGIKPLIDTTQYLNAITYVIRRIKGK